jgi:dihydrofolate reductase
VARERNADQNHGGPETWERRPARGENAAAQDRSMGHAQPGYRCAMRKLVVTENITVDGVIDMAEGWFDPLAEDVDQSDITAASAEHRNAADALLVGRATFEAFREFWPRQTDDPTGVSDYLNAVDKYVVSTTLEDPGWENTTILRGDLLEAVQALKDADGQDIVATGSVQLVHALIAADLVDEYRLFVFPVVVGRGARLFETVDRPLRLLEARPFVSGAVLLRYAAR